MKIPQTNDRISIEFWDPSKKMNRYIIDRADRLTYRQLVDLAEIQLSVGRTEMKIRRMDKKEGGNRDDKYS